MKKLAAFLVLGATLAGPAAAVAQRENRSIGENQAEAKRAAKRYRKYSNKQAKRQRKQMKKYAKAQRKAAKHSSAAQDRSRF